MKLKGKALYHTLGGGLALEEAMNLVQYRLCNERDEHSLQIQ